MVPMVTCQVKNFDTIMKKGHKLEVVETEGPRSMSVLTRMVRVRDGEMSTELVNTSDKLKRKL